MTRRLAFSFFVCALAACAASTESKFQEDPMKGVGDYPPPPAGLTQVRTAVLDFEDKTPYLLSQASAEQMETLAHRSKRFSMIDRLRLKELLKEQGLEGVVDPKELAKPGRIRGVDYLILGSVTNFRVTQVRSGTSGGIFNKVPVVSTVAPLDIDTSKTEIETNVGVDVKLVNSTTGEIVAKDFGEMKRKDVASAWGVRVLGIGGDARNELRIDAESQGKIMRWALHESFKKMLPDIDQKLSRPMAAVCPKCKTEVAEGDKHCTKCGASIEAAKCACGARLAAGVRFCGSCGKEVKANQ